MSMEILTALGTLCLCLCCCVSRGESPGAMAPVEQSIWYDKPAGDWMQALPLGNGRLGCMVFGGTDQERIQFNHDTLWIGSEAHVGAYQNFGHVTIDLAHADATNYRRELDLSRAVHTIAYASAGVNYRREYFASHPANVLVFRYTADKPGGLGGRVALVDAHDATTRAEHGRLSVSDDLADHQYYDGGWRGRRMTWDNPIVLDYEAQVRVLHEGGALRCESNTVVFSGCDSLTVLLAAGTDYLNQRDKGWKGAHPHAEVTAAIDKAAQRSYEALLDEHVRDYRSLYDRFTLELGETPAAIRALPADRRLSQYRGGRPAPGQQVNYGGEALDIESAPDPDLEEILFRYARYLMIGCSRQGTMPSNLQGLWNNDNHPKWQCDYHSDVNTQMFYWFVAPANLSECFSPLSEWFYSIREVRREDTARQYKTRGFAMQVANGVFGGSMHSWSVGDASWLANNLMDHYRHTLDRTFLETRLYPILKDLFMFWEDHLVERPSPDGTGTVLVAPRAYSPEIPPRADGVSYAQQWAWDLLSNYAEVTTILGVDAAEREKALEMRDRLLGPRVGRWGQLQEWMEDRDDPETTHRHVSHLCALYPGLQISPRTTPQWAEAAKVSLNARGDGGPGWSKTWKSCLWARLLDGNRAYKVLRGQVQGNVYDNLLNAHPPFQIDGNFGYAAAVVEMLVQSHERLNTGSLNTGLSGWAESATDASISLSSIAPFTIHLLPALPDAWPAGWVTGMKVRGGFELDMAWAEGRLTAAEIRSAAGYPCCLRSAVPLTVMHDGKHVETRALEEGLIEFSTKAGAAYRVEVDIGEARPQ